MQYWFLYSLYTAAYLHALLHGMPKSQAKEKYAVYIIEINDWLNKL